MIAMAGNKLFYQKLHEKVFALFTPPIRAHYKYQIQSFKKGSMKHMTELFGQVWN
jgi:hypothetical protein